MNTKREEMKNKLQDIVCASQGIKAVDFASRKEVIDLLHNEDFYDVIEEMIGEKRIVEIEYRLPNMKYRTKSFFLPGETEVDRIRGL